MDELTFHFYPWIQLPTLLSCALALLIAHKAWQRRLAIGTTPIIILMVAIALWSLGAFLEDSGGELSTKVLCYHVEFLFFAAVPVIWLSMLLDYLGLGSLLTPRNIALVSIVPFLCVLLYWLDLPHRFVIATSSLATDSGMPYLLLTYGTGFWIFVAYSYVLAFLGVIVCLLAALSSVPVYRRQALTLLVGGLVPIIVSAFDFTYAILPAWNLTPIAFLFTGGAMLWGMYRFNLWDISPVAYQVMFQKMLDGIFVVNASHRIIEINPAGCTLLNTTTSELIGKSIDVISAKLPKFSSADLTENDKHLFSDYSGRPESSYDIRITPLIGQRQEFSGWLVVMRDISDRKLLEEKLQVLAYYDILTGLPNRALLRDRLEQTLKRNRRNELLSGVIFLDLDRFKEINDTYGHSVGDDILHQTAKRLRSAVRDSDTVSRFGGDEFVLVFPDIPDRETLAMMAQRILDVFEAPFTLKENLLFNLAPSLGLALAPMDGDSVDFVLKNADIAMYQAKYSGGGRYAFYADTQPVA